MPPQAIKRLRDIGFGLEPRDLKLGSLAAMFRVAHSTDAHSKVKDMIQRARDDDEAFMGLRFPDWIEKQSIHAQICSAEAQLNSIGINIDSWDAGKLQNWAYATMRNHATFERYDFVKFIGARLRHCEMRLRLRHWLLVVCSS